MNPKARARSSSQGGYIGLMSLLLAVLIVGFWVAHVYGKPSSTSGKPNGLEGDPRGVESVQRTQDLKVLLEAKNRESTTESP